MFDSLVYFDKAKKRLLLQVQDRVAEDAFKHFKRHVLRSKVVVEDVSASHQVWAVLSADAQMRQEAVESLRKQEGSVLAVDDPRLDVLGAKVIRSIEQPREFCVLSSCVVCVLQ